MDKRHRRIRKALRMAMALLIACFVSWPCLTVTALADGASGSGGTQETDVAMGEQELGRQQPTKDGASTSEDLSSTGATTDEGQMGEVNVPEMASEVEGGAAGLEVQSTLHTEAVTSGTCGPNLTWRLSDLNYIVINGTGAMTSVPWKDLMGQIEGVLLPSGLTHIADGAFSGATKLSYVQVPSGSGLTYVGNSAFAECDALTSIDLRSCSALDTLGPAAFYGCERLGTVKLPQGLKCIRPWAFKGCGGLTQLLLPSSLTKLGYGFISGTNIQQMTIPASLETCEMEEGSSYPSEGPLTGAPIQTVELAQGMANVPGYLLYHCGSLRTLIVPKSVRSFGYWCTVGAAEGHANGLTIRYAGSSKDWKGVNLHFDYYNTRLDKTKPENKLTITYAQVHVDELSISSIPSMRSTGKPLTPEPTVTYDGKRLIKDKDYRLSYKDNVSVGTGYVYVVAKAEPYVGSRAVKFTITGSTNQSGSTNQGQPADQGKPKTVKTFPDVLADAWYAGVVRIATELGLISGYANGNFGPNDNITRGQIAVILWNMAGKPAPKTGAKAFPDVKSGKYYERAIKWASSVRVVSGYQDGKFRPDENVSREQLAVMLANYAARVGGKSVSGSSADYASMKDASKVSSYARTAVGWCFRNKILSGKGGSRVDPQGNATRAEASKMVVRLHELL